MRSCGCGACPGGCVADAARVPPAVATYTLEERQRLLDRIAELENGLRLNADCLGKCLTGGSVSAAHAGYALALSAELLGDAP